MKKEKTDLKSLILKSLIEKGLQESLQERVGQKVDNALKQEIIQEVTSVIQEVLWEHSLKASSEIQQVVRDSLRINNYGQTIEVDLAGCVSILEESMFIKQ